MGALVSCCASQIGFCITSAACNVCCRSCGCASSTATRIAYGVIFFLFTILAWAMLSDWAKDELTKVPRIASDFVEAHCVQEGACNVEDMIGQMGVFRVCWAMALFYATMAAIMVCVRSGRDPRRGLQNGWWLIKALLIVGLLIGAFFLPNSFFLGWNIVAMVGATIFILIQLLLLIDFAYDWQQGWVEKWEETGSRGWLALLLGCTFGLFGASLVMTVLMYVYFTSGTCHLSKFFISFNLIGSVLVSVLSVLPQVQEHNERTGLLQSACVVSYATYLVFSAVSSMPNEECAALQGGPGGMATAVTVIGALFTFVAVAYSTIRTSDRSQLSALGLGPDEEPMLESLPMTDGEDEDDEEDGVHYNWSFFHLTFALASLYIMMVLTNWGMVSASSDEQVHGLKVGAGMASVWAKITSSWVALLLYSWTVVAPFMCVDRDFS